MIAIISMTFDHFGKEFFPDLIILQIIGRLAFPIFAYCIVVGCLYTSSFKKYIQRLLIFGVLSQPIYILSSFPNWSEFVENFWVLNIFFTLALGAVAIKSLEQKNWIVLALDILTVSMFNFDYGIYGITIMLIFYIFRNNYSWAIIVSSLYMVMPFFTSSEVCIAGYSLGLQGFAVMALIPIFWKTSFNPKINKYFFYIYYPAHLFVIFIIRILNY
ncbi:MAG: TraX family protein [Proteocatella sp.]